MRYYIVTTICRAQLARKVKIQETQSALPLSIPLCENCARHRFEISISWCNWMQHKRRIEQRRCYPNGDLQTRLTKSSTTQARQWCAYPRAMAIDATPQVPDGGLLTSSGTRQSWTRVSRNTLWQTGARHRMWTSQALHHSSKSWTNGPSTTAFALHFSCCHPSSKQ